MGMILQTKRQCVCYVATLTQSTTKIISVQKTSYLFGNDNKKGINGKSQIFTTARHVYQNAAQKTKQQ